MTNNDTDFDTWFETLVSHLADEGVAFSCRDSVRDDFEGGKDVFDVVDDIKAEYAA